MTRTGILLTLLLSVNASASGWTYVRSGSSQAASLTTRGNSAVSLKEFCHALGCTTLHNWNAWKVIVRNPAAKSLTAVLSPLTQTAIAAGNVVEFQGKIEADSKDGYVLPLELAGKLAAALELGRVIEPPKPTPVAAAQAQEVTSTLRQMKTIVIDPGHGGYDVGTKFGELYEKDIALFYALQLRDALKKEVPDVQILLTRERDEFVSLQDRAKFANGKLADFFISLHVNHAADTSAYGSETYILNPNATDDEARQTALVENDTWLKSLKNKDQAGSPVMNILADMERTKYIQNSAYAAAFIQQELAELDPQVRTKNRGVKQAMFFVLSQVAMPSVLVEMGFLSSQHDRARMMDLKFRDQFVTRVIAALKRYRER